MSDTTEASAKPPAYRAMLLLPDGQVVGSEHLTATDDEEAIAQAQTLMNGHAIELWDGLRFIEHFDVEGVKPGGGSDRLALDNEELSAYAFEKHHLSRRQRTP